MEESRIIPRPDLPAAEGSTYELVMDLGGEQAAEPPRGEDVTIRLTLYRRLGKQRETVATPDRAKVSSALELLLNLLPSSAWTMEYEGENITTICIDWSQVPMGIRDPQIPGRRVI